eukprot:TRINITY_DN5780_c0_g2_i1.p1 TRINITY_DN5780_c0_g2~~TRINITY_DN5780_c0_g2_i1.p1  ORF type:complete len:190 (-),score=16.21 TRINITY_DN5780_c0_g2_i1:10-579(-)
MKRLIEQRVPINHANKKGDTALIRAAWKGEVLAVRLLLEQKADMNHTNMAGLNALLTASLHDQRSCLKILLQFNSPVDTIDITGRTALMTLSEYRGPRGINWEGVELLLKKGANTNLNLPVHVSNSTLGTSVLTIPERVGDKLILAAATQNLHSVTQLLLEKGANANHSEIGRAVQQECRDRSRMPSSA